RVVVFSFRRWPLPISTLFPYTTLFRSIFRLPQRDVVVHVDFLRHPVVCTSVQILLPSPFVFEWNKLVQVCTTVDHSFIINLHTLRTHFKLFQTRCNIKLL